MSIWTISMCLRSWFSKMLKVVIFDKYCHEQLFFVKGQFMSLTVEWSLKGG